MKNDNSAVHIFQYSTSLPASSDGDKHYQLIETNYKSQTPNLNAYFTEKPKELTIDNAFNINIIQENTPKIMNQKNTISNHQGIIDAINQLKERYNELCNVNSKLKSNIEEMNIINEKNIETIIKQEEEIKQLNAQLLQIYSNNIN